VEELERALTVRLLVPEVLGLMFLVWSLNTVSRLFFQDLQDVILLEVLPLPASLIASASTALYHGVGWVTCLHLGAGLFNFGDLEGIRWGAIDDIVYSICASATQHSAQSLSRN
jgi:hypothetical protein